MGEVSGGGKKAEEIDFLRDFGSRTDEPRTWFSVFCFERLKGWHVKLDTDYPYLACGCILSPDRKLVDTRNLILGDRSASTYNCTFSGVIGKGWGFG